MNYLNWSGILQNVIAAVLGAVLLGIATVVWVWTSQGGLIHRLHGATIADVHRLQGQIAALQKEDAKLKDVQRLQAQVTKIQTASGYVVVKGTNDAMARTGKVTGLSGRDDLNNKNNVECPPGSFVSAIQGFANGQGVLFGIRYACRSVR